MWAAQMPWPGPTRVQRSPVCGDSSVCGGGTLTPWDCSPRGSPRSIKEREARQHNSQPGLHLSSRDGGICCEAERASPQASTSASADRGASAVAVNPICSKRVSLSSHTIRTPQICDMGLKPLLRMLCQFAGSESSTNQRQRTITSLTTYCSSESPRRTPQAVSPCTSSGQVDHGKRTSPRYVPSGSKTS